MAKTTRPALTQYKRNSKSGQRVRYEKVALDGADEAMIVAHVARFDPVSGERIDDDVNYPRLSQLREQRAAHATKVEQLDEEIEALEAFLKTEEEVK